MEDDDDADDDAGDDDEESHKAVVVLRVPPAGMEMEMEVTTEDEECRGCDDPKRGLETNCVRARRVET